MFVALVSNTTYARIKYKTLQKALYDICYNARAASDNAYRMCLKLIFRTLTRTASKHNANAHLLQHRGDI